MGGIAIVVIFITVIVYICEKMDAKYRKQNLLKQSQDRLKELEEKSKLRKF